MSRNAGVLGASAAVAAAACGCAFADVGPAGLSIFESFEEGFGRWTAQGSVGFVCPQFDFTVTRTQAIAHEGNWSLDFTASGLCDDGTVWVERSLILPPGTWDLSVEFQFWSKQADIGTWELVAFIGVDNPEREEDFVNLGLAGVGGWSPYTLGETITVAEPTEVWVAVGYNIVFEVVRTHWFDSIEIDGAPPQPDGPDLNGDGVVSSADLAILLGAWGSCGVDAPCPADLDGDGSVSSADLAALLGAWGG